MIKRRDVLTAGVAGSLAGAALTASAAAATLPPKVKEPALRIKRAKRPLLINRARATREMTKAGLDAMVVRDASNVYYATNHWSVYTDYGSQQPTYAVIPRQADRPIIAIAPWVEMWKIAEDDAEYGPMIIYDGRVANRGARTTFATDAIASGAPLGVVEKKLLETQETAWANAEPTPMAGVMKALKESGVSTGRVGVDDARIMIDMGEAGLEGPTWVVAVPMMYRIRQVKTAPEIELLRMAAQCSADSAIAAVNRLGPGATQNDLRYMFREETARRGGGYLTIAAGGPDLPNHILEPGRPFMIDGVATVDHYCGDFGRTVVLGEPVESVKKACKRLAVAWNGVFEQLRPGVRFSEVKGFGYDAVTKAGFDVKGLGIGAHSVGLQHSEDPMKNGMIEADFVLEPGMVVSVDHPYTMLGWGTTHLEDLSVITEHGAEPLNVHSEALIVI
jgi:Xaa-Pro aminopeptidase